MFIATLITSFNVSANCDHMKYFDHFSKRLKETEKMYIDLKSGLRSSTMKIAKYLEKNLKNHLLSKIKVNLVNLSKFHLMTLKRK